MRMLTHARLCCLVTAQLCERWQISLFAYQVHRLINWLNDCFTAQHSKLISAKEAVSYFTRLTLGRHSRQAGKPRVYIFYPGTNTGRNELRINERRATELAVGTRYVNVTTKQTNYNTRTYYRPNGLLIFSTGILSLSLGNWSGHVLHSYRQRKKWAKGNRVIWSLTRRLVEILWFWQYASWWNCKTREESLIPIGVVNVTHRKIATNVSEGSKDTVVIKIGWTNERQMIRQLSNNIKCSLVSSSSN